MSESSPQMFDDCILAQRSAGHGGMAALARKHELACGMRYVDRHPKARAGAKRCKRGSRDRPMAA
jgi:hypothetical protein